MHRILLPFIQTAFPKPVVRLIEMPLSQAGPPAGSKAAPPDFRLFRLFRLFCLFRLFRLSEAYYILYFQYKNLFFHNVDRFLHHARPHPH